MPCPVAYFGVSIGLVWLLAACLLVGRVMFLCCCRFCVRGPALDLACLGVGPGLSAEMEAFGRAHHLSLCDDLEGWGGAWEGASGGKGYMYNYG